MKKKIDYRYFLYPIILVFSISIITLTGIYDKKITEYIFTPQKNFFTILFKDFPVIVYFFVFWTIIFLFITNITSLKNWDNKRKRKNILALFYIADVSTFICYLAYKNFFSIVNSTEISVSVFIFFLFVAYSIIFPIYWIKIKKYKTMQVEINKFAKALIFIIICLLITMFNKWLFARNRPFQYYSSVDYQFTHIFQINFSKLKGNSFNSGHTISVALIISLAYLSDSKKLKYYIFGIGLSLTFITAISRVLIFAHWSSDVAFSIGLAIITYPAIGELTEIFAKIIINKQNKAKDIEKNG